MRVYVMGENASAKQLRSLIAQDRILSLSDGGAYNLKLDIRQSAQGTPMLDGVDSVFVRSAVKQIGLVSHAGQVTVALSGGENFDERTVIITVSVNEQIAASEIRGVYRALIEYGQASRGVQPIPMREDDPSIVFEALDRQHRTIQDHVRETLDAVESMREVMQARMDQLAVDEATARGNAIADTLTVLRAELSELTTATGAQLDAMQRQIDGLAAPRIPWYRRLWAR